ncbi:bifunctional tRNA (5-methylaminomethyl-2-thiouridine)(34)-methyltransferase MnmD/FAD-dependent 5-carboxymethylaminomethyl-2-thiouridine(34) oxidoreductase MnmC [Echinimonas agarilytica]|uniref:tRNA 5-methylaminomethyl-2-thiouridine biosynthesis bifunctional protein MnmC n=1 Tax=Echinimonas agarilytica TaxID=1215918 RepID=A0AA42B7G1_9GAMM|nr:bifunctional tRNA (5-methylaminomethyl-2-thiouridine)(34)-methyltransferase MnmD/FAD-dependent 5-carboxymethylaminomethyl-2-thiouridine(34) oxidoreductase MnmC [Echinimonas agarilytica]MCM2679238.1 bifunctional tRNA (5-methylaminomethyl-2-thiouridine)(34)-methyltransferase MnmD/FAD-dependent 5-carboxymethylaminomethyl-2-thiouridine(34) oxidoreductase MnmC [Echinimonas agarilytica]
MNTNIKITHANLHFNADGTPVADDFDDVYFSNDDGLAETQYVFLAGNQLLKRWRAHTCSVFTVAETGFGSGMNFLALRQAFDDFLVTQSNRNACRLHFITFEKYPMTLDALEQSHQQFPSLCNYAQALRAQYPEHPIPGCHRLEFDQGRITLDLWFGDANDILPELSTANHGIVDAWFLDGFAPSKNPDMWSSTLFKHMFRLAKPYATVATFTAAGFVRRGLAEAGFEVSKISGYGNKRDMTVATKPNKTITQTGTAPCEQKVAVIGGGLSGCLTAWELSNRGYSVTLICKDSSLAQQASGNRQGALYPLLSPAEEHVSQFFLHAYRFSRMRLAQLTSLTASIAHQWCGVLHLSCNDDLIRKHKSIANFHFPESVVHSVDAAQASDLAGIELEYPGIFYPNGGWFCPGDICRFIAAELHAKGQPVKLDMNVDEIEKVGHVWALTTSAEVLEFDTVVIASGADSAKFDVTQHIPLNAVRGQVSHVPETSNTSPLKTVLCHTGYVTPAHDGEHCIGATFVRRTTHTELSEEEHQTNLQRLSDRLQSSVLANEWEHSPMAGKVGFRASVRDHMPLVGSVPDWDSLALRTTHGDMKNLPHAQGLYIISGLGARGICSAPIAANIIANYIDGTAQPVEQSILDVIDPSRFGWRRLRKGRTPFGPE